MKKIMIINGPNLNLLGVREPEIYGYDTIEDLAQICYKEAEEYEVTIDFRQSNHEGEIIDYIHETKLSQDQEYIGIIINPGAYTHTSIAIMDALYAIDIIKIEVHLSNTHAREEFRSASYTARAVNGVICGLGVAGYILAIQTIASTVE